MVWTTNVLTYRTIGALFTPTPFKDKEIIWPIIWNSPVNESPYYLPIQKFTSGIGTPVNANNQYLLSFTDAEFYGISSRVVSMSIKVNSNYITQSGTTKYIYGGFMIPTTFMSIPYGFQPASSVKRYVLDENQNSGGLPSDSYFFILPSNSSMNKFRNARESAYFDQPEMVEHPWQIPDTNPVESSQYVPFSFGHYNTYNQSVTSPEHKPITYDVTFAIEYYSELPLTTDTPLNIFRQGLCNYQYLEMCSLACEVLNTFNASEAQYYIEYIEMLENLIARINWLKPRLRSRTNITGSAEEYYAPSLFVRDTEEGYSYLY